MHIANSSTVSKDWKLKSAVISELQSREIYAHEVVMVGNTCQERDLHIHAGLSIRMKSCITSYQHG